jgi:transcription elongation factor GreA
VALGDLSENAEYHAALERQTFVRARIGQIRKRLAELALVNWGDIPKDRIGLGSRVVLYEDETEAEITYELVLPDDGDVAQGRISVASPIGKGLMGHREGDEVTIRIPSGTKEY